MSGHFLTASKGGGIASSPDASRCANHLILVPRLNPSHVAGPSNITKQQTTRTPAATAGGKWSLLMAKEYAGYNTITRTMLQVIRTRKGWMRRAAQYTSNASIDRRTRASIVFLFNGSGSVNWVKASIA